MVGVGGEGVGGRCWGGGFSFSRVECAADFFGVVMKLDKLLGGVLAVVIMAGLGWAKDLAEVDGQVITERDFDVLKQQAPNFDFEKLNIEQKASLIQQKINEVLIVKDATKAKVHESKEYKEALENIKRQLLINGWQQAIAQEAASAALPEREVREFYESNKGQFIQQEGRARHILLNNREEAEKLITELKKTGKSRVEQKFIELANKHSIDPSSQRAQNGGDVGTFQRNQVAPEFAEAAFGLNEGSFTQSPVRTDFGYHVIYLVKKGEAKSMSFEEARPGIEGAFRERKFQELVQRKIQELRSNAKITIH